MRSPHKTSRPAVDIAPLDDIRVCMTRSLLAAARETFALTLPGGALSIWTGPDGVGRRVGAQLYGEMVNRAFEVEDPSALRARGVTLTYGADAEDDYLETVFDMLLLRVSPLRPGESATVGTDVLAMRLIDQYVARRVGTVVIHGAHVMTVPAWEEIALLRDAAVAVGWPLTVVLVGSPRLAVTLSANARLTRAGARVCLLEPLTLAGSAEFVAHAHPRPGGYDWGCADDRALIEAAHEASGGLPGRISELMRDAQAISRRAGHALDVDALRHAVERRGAREARRAVARGRGEMRRA